MIFKRPDREFALFGRVITIQQNMIARQYFCGLDNVDAMFQYRRSAFSVVPFKLHLNPI